LSGYLPAVGGYPLVRKPLISRQHVSAGFVVGQVRIPVAVLAFSLQMSTFEGVKMAFGGATGGRLQEPASPRRAQTWSWLGPI
jgi:hypothetical protein